MSWFEYGTPKKRCIRKGVWLRIRCLPSSILKEAKRKMRFGEVVSRVVVKEVHSECRVLLEFWCNSPVDMIRGKDRYNVFYVETTEDPKWICEGDLGRGYKE